MISANVKFAVGIGVGLTAGVNVAVGGAGVAVSAGVADAGISVAAGEQLARTMIISPIPIRRIGVSIVNCLSVIKSI
mgnify:CR=1 FL=1